jgi:hypothetical protein
MKFWHEAETLGLQKLDIKISIISFSNFRPLA